MFFLKNCFKKVLKNCPEQLFNLFQVAIFEQVQNRKIVKIENEKSKKMQEFVKEYITKNLRLFVGPPAVSFSFRLLRSCWILKWFCKISSTIWPILIFPAWTPLFLLIVYIHVYCRYYCTQNYFKNRRGGEEKSCEELQSPKICEKLPRAIIYFFWRGNFSGKTQ